MNFSKEPAISQVQRNDFFITSHPLDCITKIPALQLQSSFTQQSRLFFCLLFLAFFRERQLQRRDKSEKKKSEENINKRRFSSRKSSFLYGGSGWIRTTEVTDNRFTVCPLWPLGYTPVLSLKNSVGAGGRTRTPDLLITNQLLYQLSYTSKLSAERKC